MMHLADLNLARILLKTTRRARAFNARKGRKAGPISFFSNAPTQVGAPEVPPPERFNPPNTTDS